MKNTLLILSALLLLSKPASSQMLQNDRKTILFIEEWMCCGNTYDTWATGLLDTLVSIQNSAACPGYCLQFGDDTLCGHDIFWTGYNDLSYNYAHMLAEPPMIYTDNYGVYVPEVLYDDMDPTMTRYVYPRVTDTILNYVRQYSTGPAECAVGLNKTMVTPDSVLITAKTRFNISDHGVFSMAVYGIEDSVLEMLGGITPVLHRYLIRTDMGRGTWGAGLAATVHASDTFVKNFTLKIPPAWNASRMSYMVIVYKQDSTGIFHVLNATDGHFTNLTTGLNMVKKDMTDNMKVFPVPAKDNVTVEMQTDKALNNCTIGLYDISGRQVAILYHGIVEPSASITLQLPKTLAPGNYMLQLHNENVSAVRQVTIK